MSFYRTCMRCASPILFWVAVIAFVATLFGYLSNDLGNFSAGYAQFDGHELARLTTVALAIASASSTAAWPFFGAAVLWLLDRKLPDAEAAE